MGKVIVEARKNREKKGGESGYHVPGTNTPRENVETPSTFVVEKNEFRRQ